MKRKKKKEKKLYRNVDVEVNKYGRYAKKSAAGFKYFKLKNIKS